MTRDSRSHTSASAGLTYMGEPASPVKASKLRVLSSQVPAWVRLGIIRASAEDAAQLAGSTPSAGLLRWHARPAGALHMREMAAAGSCGQGWWTE
jgi:hypothetical protein